MRRLLTLCIVVGLVLASAAPAGGAPVKAEPIQVVECIVPGDLGEAKIWFTGQNDKIMHIRDLVNTATELQYVEGLGWVPIGINEIGVNYNGAWAAVPDFGPVPTVGTYWGTFDLELEDIGELTGNWSWAKGAVDGRGSGSGDGLLIEVDLLGEDPGWLPGYPPGCGFVEYTVKTK